MSSNPQRIDEVFRHLGRIKAGDYPVVMGNALGGGYRIVERPWQDLAEPSKLAILSEAIDWQGISNRDKAHILLAQVDPGKITTEQRRQLIDQATLPVSEGVDGRLDALRSELGQRKNAPERDGNDRGRDR